MARLEPSHWVCFVLQGIFLTPFNSFKTWSNPIYSWELSFQFSMSNVFQMKLWSCRRILWLCFWRFLKGGSRDIGALVDCLCASCFCLSLQILSGGLRSCCLIVWSCDCSSGGVVFVGSWFSLSAMWWQGLQKFWRYCFNMSQVICSLSSFFLVSLCRMSLRATSILSNGLLIIPKVPNFLGGYPKLLEGLPRDCKWCTGKSAPWLTFSLSHDGEGFEGLLPSSPTGFWCSRISSCSMRRRG